MSCLAVAAVTQCVTQSNHFSDQFVCCSNQPSSLQTGFSQFSPVRTCFALESGLMGYRSGSVRSGQEKSTVVYRPREIKRSILPAFILWSLFFLPVSVVPVSFKQNALKMAEWRPKTRPRHVTRCQTHRKHSLRFSIFLYTMSISHP